MTLKDKDFLTLLDFSKEEITYLLDLAAKLKDEKKKGIKHDVLQGKNVVLLFEKSNNFKKSFLFKFIIVLLISLPLLVA